ncbi:MAG: hypothetical protein MK108_18765 [Mariniblastus sp.]|nr:hypothetical protein [Mariniblastus sp.]
MNESPEPVGMPEARASRDGKTSPRPYRAIILIGSFLLTWAVLLAAGALWSGDPFRRSIVILASMGCFLAVWAAALWLKKRRC